MSGLDATTLSLVVGPLLVAALLGGLAVLPIGRVVADPVALVVAGAVTVASGWAAVSVGDGTHVVWAGDWQPTHGEPIGVAVVLDRPAALLICLVGLLTVAALAYSWHFLADTGTAYEVLVLLFLGACAGFVLAGDVFDAFVWFELMGVAAYALTGLRIEEPRSVHGALGFGIVNTVGASLSLSGVALLYARTGELNLAAMGRALAHGSPGNDLVAVACALLLTGVLVKMALVPFHFWTADAEAVAPTPVCVLLSGAMITVGAFAVARWWWVVFDGSLPASAISHALIGFGAVTAVVGALMCTRQRHVKRLLAYSTVAHSGVIACGIGLLTGPGLAAAALYAVGHAATKGALFLVTGLLLNKFESVDEHELFGRGRGMWVGGTTFIVGGLALAGLPPIGTWAGKAAFSTAFADAHTEWLEVVVVLVSALTGGSVLRAGLRIFVGLGDRPARTPERGHEEPESDQPLAGGAFRIVVPPVVLLALTAALGIWSGTATAAARVGQVMTDHAGYLAAVLGGGSPHRPPVTAESLWLPLPVLLGLLSALLAVGLALTWLWPGRLPAVVRSGLTPLRPVLRGLHAIHRAHVGDYVSWLLVGFAVLGATLLLG